MTTTTLITGANKGPGLEPARRLTADGHEVWMAARDPIRGRSAAQQVGGHFVALDVTDESSVAAAVEQAQAESGMLDVLINNAGIAGSHAPVEETTAEDPRTSSTPRVRDRPCHTGVPAAAAALRESRDRQRLQRDGVVGRDQRPAAGRVDPGRTRLSALEDGGEHDHHDVRQGPAKIRSNAVDPGCTATDLDGHRGTQTVTEGTEAIVRMAKLDASGSTGTFVDSGGVAPW